MTNDSRVTFSSNKKAYFINYHLSSTSAFFLFLTSVSDMSSRDKHVSCCIPTSYKYNYSCGYCCSVFISSEEKTKHNLLHFNPCPMCRLTLRSRESLIRHMHTDHNQPLASIKRHTTQCKTYKLPVIPERLSKVKMAEEVEKVSRLGTVKEVKVVEEAISPKNSLNSLTTASVGPLRPSSTKVLIFFRLLCYHHCFKS